jgi:adenosine deaminase
MTGEVTDADLAALPKAHLHLHFIGGMRHATLLELAGRASIRLPERLTDLEPDSWQLIGWPKFQRLYEVARGVLRTPQDMHRLLLEIAEDEQRAGSRWLELQVAPAGYAVRLGDVVTATEAFCAAAAAAEAATGVGIRVIVAANRTRPAWEAEQLARIAVRFAPHGVVGFGLSNDERRGMPEEFAKAFRIVRDGGLAATPHAGELLGAESVARTVAALSPTRLGHGVRAVEDPDVLALLADRGIACEVCPASNVALGVVEGLGAVPLKALEAAGVPVVLAADDPLLFGASLIDQYAVARDHHGYQRPDLARLARTSVTHSTMPRDLAGTLLAEIDTWETSASLH